jgi:putative transposase
MIVLEDLSTQMRSRMMPNLARKRHANIYARMQQVLEYKAQLAGIQTDMVSTHWTRQTCPRCGFISTENKIKIEEESGRHVAYFSCRECGYQDDADAVAAINIARRAVYKRSCTEARHSGEMKVTWEEFARLIVSAR